MPWLAYAGSLAYEFSWVFATWPSAGVAGPDCPACPEAPTQPASCPVHGGEAWANDSEAGMVRRWFQPALLAVALMAAFFVGRCSRPVPLVEGIEFPTSRLHAVRTWRRVDARGSLNGVLSRIGAGCASALTAVPPAPGTDMVTEDSSALGLAGLTSH